MSILHNSKFGWFISHSQLIKEIYRDLNGTNKNFSFKPELFKITAPYKASKQKLNLSSKDQDLKSELAFESRHVEDLYNSFYKEIRPHLTEEIEVRNEEALRIATLVYAESNKFLIENASGVNCGPATIKIVSEGKFLFPENCRFFCRDVLDLSQYLQQKFDLILLDPPWWNKYIRRKRKRTNEAYNMMFNEDLKQLPLENYLNEEGIVVVWCTNSQQHLDVLTNEILPKWGLKFLGKWYWVKVTLSGKPICDFSTPPKKQPFEQIVIGVRETRTLQNPPHDKLVISVPSALHSHKPPLIRILEPYLPPRPECLEVFARYLLPNWTSYGKEALKLQHESLYSEFIGIKKEDATYE